MRHSLDSLLFIAYSLAVIAGCGKGDHSAPIHPVSGQVVMQGKPLKMAFVLLYPKDEAKIKFRPAAYTDADGRFEIKPGAPAGEYVATIVWTGAPDEENRDELPDRLQGRYADPAASPFKVSIKEGKNVLPPFQVK